MRRRNEAFTLVELMIVVAIIGVLAAIAVYGVSKYLKAAKTAEATRALGSLENGQRQQFQRETAWPPGSTTSDRYEHTFCPDAPMTPNEVPLGQRVKVPADKWDAIGWTCAKFNLNDPQFYSYQVVGNGLFGTAAVYSASAHGDLDGNGTTSLFEIVGHGGVLGDSVRDNFRVIKADE